MVRKSAEVEEWVQKIDENMKEDFTFYPSEIPFYFVNNVFQRTLAHLIAYTEDNKAIRLRATREGLLKVSTYPIVFEEYETESGTASDTYTSENTYEFDKSYSRWDLLIENGDAVISFKKTDGTWGDDIILPEGFHSFDFSALGVRIRNRVSGVDVSYYITVFR